MEYSVYRPDYTECIKLHYSPRLTRVSGMRTMGHRVYVQTRARARSSHTYFPRWVNEIPEIIQMERRSQRVYLQPKPAPPFRLAG